MRDRAANADLIASMAEIVAAKCAADGIDIIDAAEIVNIMAALERTPGNAACARCEEYCERSPEHFKRFEKVARFINGMIAPATGRQSQGLCDA